MSQLNAQDVSIQVQSSRSSPLLQNKTIMPTANTQYITASSGYDGLSQVTVQGDSNLISSNIKSGISIFGVSGSLSSADFVGLWVVQIGSRTINLSITNPFGKNFNPRLIFALHIECQKRRQNNSLQKQILLAKSYSDNVVGYPASTWSGEATYYGTDTISANLVNPEYIVTTTDSTITFTCDNNNDIGQNTVYTTSANYSIMLLVRSTFY